MNWSLIFLIIGNLFCIGIELLIIYFALMIAYITCAGLFDIQSGKFTGHKHKNRR